MSRYQKGKTNLDFTEARDSEWQWHQLGHMQSAPRSRQITTPASHHSVFYRPDALPAAQSTVSKHWRKKCFRNSIEKIDFSSFLVCLQYFTCVIEHVPSNCFIARFRAAVSVLSDLAVPLF